MKLNRLGVSIGALVLSFSVLVFAQNISPTAFGDEVVEEPTPITEAELIRELEVTTTAFFLATQDASLKLWYEMQLDGIVKKYVPEADHEAIGEEIVALQGEVDEMHEGLRMALFIALIQGGVQNPEETMSAAVEVFVQEYLTTGGLIHSLSEDMSGEQNEQSF